MRHFPRLLTALLGLALAPRPTLTGMIDTLHEAEIEILVDVVLIGLNGDGHDAMQASGARSRAPRSRIRPLARFLAPSRVKRSPAACIR